MDGPQWLLILRLLRFCTWHHLDSKTNHQCLHDPCEHSYSLCRCGMHCFAFQCLEHYHSGCKPPHAFCYRDYSNQHFFKHHDCWETPYNLKLQWVQYCVASKVTKSPPKRSKACLSVRPFSGWTSGPSVSSNSYVLAQNPCWSTFLLVPGEIAIPQHVWKPVLVPRSLHQLWVGVGSLLVPRKFKFAGTVEVWFSDSWRTLSFFPLQVCSVCSWIFKRLNACSFSQ